MTKPLQPKQVKFYKRPRNFVLSAILLIVIIWIAYAVTKDKPLDITTLVAEKGELVQEVSVTGRVEPSESVKLGFEISGKVSEIYADVGDRVEAGDKLISLGSADLYAQLRQAQAGSASAAAMLNQYQAAVDREQARLDEMKRGTRTEEIQIAQTNVQNAQNSLDNAAINLENVKNKANVDLENAYNSALTGLPIAVNAGKAALISLTEIQYEHFDNYTSDATKIANAKQDAAFSLLGASNAGKWATYAISTASGGIYGEVQQIVLNPSHFKIDQALIDAGNALQKVKIALDVVPTGSISDANKTKLEAEKGNISAQITTLSNHNQAIAVQKTSNENFISTAETQVETAENALKAAQDQLKLVQAGYTAEQIRAQEATLNQAKASLASQRAMVSQAYASVQQAQAQIAKTILYAPISGLITKMEAKVGEIVFPSSPYSDSRTVFVSIISDDNYEIEANVSEVDIAKIKIGDMSRVTLDAYGDEVIFPAKVVSVDPAETVVEGIPTYKVTLLFTEESEEIKSGMTANLDILTDKEDDVIAIPQRAIIEKNNKKIVRIIKEGSDMKDGIEDEIEEVEVVTGLKGSDGRVEITEGLEEGDIVVISINE